MIEKVSRRRFLTCVAIATVTSTALLPRSASAGHDDAPWYTTRWTNQFTNGIQEDRTPQWRFDDGYPPGSAWRGRAISAADAWSNIPGLMNFDFQSSLPDCTSFGFNGDNCGDYQENMVGMISLSGGAYASIRSCTLGGNYFNFRIAVDSDRVPSDPAVAGSFYEGTSTSWSGVRPDLWGSLTHEFGHATGRIPFGPIPEDGHFEANDAAACPGGEEFDSEADSTMCQSLPSNTAKFRTLTSHDIDSFEKVLGYD